MASITRQTRKSLKYPFDSLVPQQMDQHSYHSHIGIVAVLQYWPPKCLCTRGSLLCSLTSQTQPTPARILFSILKAIPTRVGWAWLTKLASRARLVHLFSSKPKFAPCVPSSKLSQVQSSHYVIHDPIAPQNLKPQNLILVALPAFHKNFHPWK